MARALAAPSLRYERQLLRSGLSSIACLDEAGRGALSGPVSVGVVVVTMATKTAPKGVRDSKLLSAERREELVPSIRTWADHAVGLATSGEIDQRGILGAMSLAGQRALAALPFVPDCVLLDGNLDYLNGSLQRSLFEEEGTVEIPPVVTRVKADLHCAGVAAASILAKTTRDAVMVELASQFPAYGWQQNKGYAAPEHLDALRRLGPTCHHRVSWSLPPRTVTSPEDAA